MIKKLIAIALLTVSLAAVAVDGLVYSWDVPTERVDGSELLKSDIVGYSIVYDIDGIPYPHVIINASTESIAIPGTAGTWTAKIATMTAEGVGPYSEPLVSILEATEKELPSAPTNFELRVLCGEAGCTLEIK